MPRRRKDIAADAPWRQTALTLLLIAKEFAAPYPTAFFEGMAGTAAGRVPAWLHGEAAPEPETEVALLRCVAVRYADSQDRIARWRTMLADARVQDVHAQEARRVLDPEGATAQIVWPEHDSTVGSQSVTVQGYVYRLPLGCRAYIASRIDPDGLVWPKDPMLDLPHGEGKFRVRVYEGGQRGRRYYSVLMVNPAGARQITEWLAKGSQTGHFPGLTMNRSRMVVLVEIDIFLSPTDDV